MLAPFDGDTAPQAAWPSITVSLSRQVFNVDRDTNCRITKNTISIRNNGLYDFLRRAALSGQTFVLIRIYPSPGNFEESVDSNWFNPTSRPTGRTLILDEDRRPQNWSACNNDERFRTIADIGDEMIAIQGFVGDRGWSIYGFTPANEPNTEWYGPYGSTVPYPDYTQGGPWDAMDDYFSGIYNYVQAHRTTYTRVFTPPMAQNALAETRSVVFCSTNTFSGYELMNKTYNSYAPANDGYTWHNYFVEGKEAWADCPTGQHVSRYFPYVMAQMIRDRNRPGFIMEADLAPPYGGFANWNNPLTNKAGAPYSAATSLYKFFREEAVVGVSEGGANRIAAWLLNDDCNNSTMPCPQHQWAQAFDSHPGADRFLLWFLHWWYTPE